MKITRKKIKNINEYHEVGEIVEYGSYLLRVSAVVSCNFCFFVDKDCPPHGLCFDYNRKDKKNITYEKV